MPIDTIVAQSIPSLINGVSQQPTSQRLTSQAESQINMLSDIAEGVSVRPPMEHIARLTGSAAGAVPTGGYKTHVIDRGDGQQFFVLLEDGDVNVYDASGAEVTVNDNAAGSPGSYTYLDFDTSAMTAEEAFAITTVADYTFIVNRTKVTAMSGSASAGRAQAHEFLLFIKGMGVNGTQSIINLSFDTTTVNYSSAVTDTDDAMDRLCTNLCGTSSPSDTTGNAGGSVNDWKFTRVGGNVLYGYQFQGTNDTVTASDTYGDTLFVLLATGPNGEDPTVARFSDLPANGYDGFTVKVKGIEDANNDDDFYVTYSQDDHVWVESTKPGLDNSFSAATMPHALVYNSGTGQFSFEPITWTARTVGDTLSSPEPSFVGKTISDILVHKNRLVLLSDENVILSESGEFFNFFPTTATALLDSDPIDIAGTGNTVALWDRAVPYLGNLTLFSSTGKLISELVGSRDAPLTIKNARIEERLVHDHEDIRPVSVGSALYFLLDRGGSSSVRSYTQVDIDRFTSDEVTGHVQRFLPPNITHMEGTSAQNIVAFLTSDSDKRNRIYIYRFHFLGNDQVLTSWSYWTTAASDTIVAIQWIRSVLYVFISRADGFHLEKMDFGKLDEDEGAGSTPLGYRVHLDSLVEVTGVYTPFPVNSTSWTIPYSQNTIGGTYRLVKSGNWGATRGDAIPILSSAVDGAVTASGDWHNYSVYFGREYTWTYELSQFHVRDRSGNVDRGRLVGNLHISNATVAYRDAGAFNVEIKSRNDSDTYTDSFTATDPDTLERGDFKFDVGGDSKDVRVILTGTYRPCKLSALDWEGRYRQFSDQT